MSYLPPDDPKVVAVATALLAYHENNRKRTWRDLAATALAAAEAYDHLVTEPDLP